MWRRRAAGWGAGAALLVAVGGSTACPAPEPDPDAVASLQVQAAAAYNQGDYPRQTELLARLLEADPDNHVARYNLACGQALSGRGDLALTELRTLADRGIDFGAANDPDFAALRGDPRFQEIIAGMDAKYPPVSTSQVVIELDDLDLDPEGMAWDAARQRYLLSSMRGSKIVAVTPDGSVSDFAGLDVGGVPVAVLGLRIDDDRGLLWAVGTAIPRARGYADAHAGTTAVFALDLATGRRVRAVVRPEKEPQPGFNDLVVTRGGDVYLSGSVLSRIPAGADAPQPMTPRILESNGIALDPTERFLYASTPAELLRIELATGSVARVTGPEGEPIAFFDGLYATPGPSGATALVGIQRGARWRVAQLVLDADGDEVVSVLTLERGGAPRTGLPGPPRLDGATTGAVVGETFHYLAHRRPTDEELEEIPARQRGMAVRPILMKTALPPAATGPRAPTGR
jgi:sugar lactone lactonase YvrE